MVQAFWFPKPRRDLERLTLSFIRARAFSDMHAFAPDVQTAAQKRP